MPQADPRRWVAPQDLAAVIVFLASDAARAVHGAAIPVTGELTRKSGSEPGAHEPAVAHDERLAGERVGGKAREKERHLGPVISSTVVNSPSTVWPSITFLMTSSSLIPSVRACSGICLSTSGVRTKPDR